MRDVLEIVKPVLWVALGVGIARFGLTLFGAPRAVVYVASLTVVEILGSLYFACQLAQNSRSGMRNAG